MQGGRVRCSRCRRPNVRRRRPRYRPSPKYRASPISISRCGSGFFAPRGTPLDLATLLNAAINKISSQPDIKTRLENDGAEVSALSIDQFTAFVSDEIDKYQDIIKAADIKAE